MFNKWQYDVCHVTGMVRFFLLNKTDKFIYFDNSGEIISEKDKCRTCNGRKTVQEQKIIEVKVTPGMRENEKITFYGEGDQEV